MDTPQPTPSQPPAKKSGYGKRAIWQWIAIYVVVAAVVYYAIYYFAYAKKGGYGNTNTTNSSSLY